MNRKVKWQNKIVMALVIYLLIGFIQWDSSVPAGSLEKEPALDTAYLEISAPL
jgi:hypothetical protein